MKLELGLGLSGHLSYFAVFSKSFVALLRCLVGPQNFGSKSSTTKPRNKQEHFASAFLLLRFVYTKCD